MNDEVHKLLKEIKNIVLDVTIGKPSVSLTVKAKKVLDKVLEWVNKYESKSFEMINVDIYSKISDICSELRKLKVLLDAQNIQNKSSLEAELLININNKLNTIKNSLEDKELKELDSYQKNRLLENDSKEYAQYVLEKVYECKKALDNYEEELKSRRSNLKGLEDALEEKAQSIEKAQDEFQDKLKLKNTQFTKKIQDELDKLASNIYEEQLASYFHEERLVLKGEIQPPIILASIACTILLIFFILKKTNSIMPDISEGVFLCLLSLGIFSSSLLILDFLFEFINYKYIAKNIKTDNRVQLNKIFIMNFKLKTINGLMTPFWCWLIGIFIGMGSIFVIALERYISLRNRGLSVSAYIENIIPSIALCLILIWFTWFCSKQFSYIKQICDEYEYKYVLSKSYLSYRDEAKGLGDSTEVNALLISLLDSVIKNIATSPVRLVKLDSHMPIAELLKILNPINNSTKNNK